MDPPPFTMPNLQVLCQVSAQTKVSPHLSPGLCTHQCLLTSHQVSEHTSVSSPLTPVPLQAPPDSAKWPVSICHQSQCHGQMEGLMVEQALGLALSQLDNSGWRKPCAMGSLTRLSCLCTSPRPRPPVWVYFDEVHRARATLCSS